MRRRERKSRRAPPARVTKFGKDFCAEFTAAGNRRGRIKTAKRGGLHTAIHGHEQNADACPAPALFLSVFHSTRSTSAPCAVSPVRSSRNAAYSSALVTTTGVTGRQPTPFSPLIAPPYVTKYRADFCAECIDRAARPRVGDHRKRDRPATYTVFSTACTALPAKIPVPNLYKLPNRRGE